jgi:ATP-dependent RNA helicase HelY
VPINGEYTQLTGRAAGDAESTSRAIWHPVAGGPSTPQAVAFSLASPVAPALHSTPASPTYNMAVNLGRAVFSRERARDILESSFAQFQAGLCRGGLARKVRSQWRSRYSATKRR